MKLNREKDKTWAADYNINTENALRALAAIAPQRKKRVVNLWMQDGKDSVTNIEAYGVEWNPNCGDVRYRKVAGPIELEE